MYTSYFYSVGQTSANLLSDIGALLTGETNKANLSAGCNQASTVISTGSSVAGWTLHDGSAGTNAKCYKAVCNDNGGTQYKYVVVDTNTANTILLKTYETWDAGAHTGTNVVYLSDSSTYGQRVAFGAGGRVEISASVRHISMFSYQSGVYGSTSGACPCGIFERTRMSPWDLSYSYPPFIFWNYANITANAPRLLNAAGTADVTSSTASLTLATPVGAPPTTTLPNASKVAVHYFWPYHVYNASYACIDGDISAFSKIYTTTGSYGAAFDEVTVGAETYVVWTAGTVRYVVVKG